MQYGVWDAAVSGWRSATNLPKPEADRLATQLNAQDSQPPRPKKAGYRTVDPPRPVILSLDGQQYHGLLDAWSKEGGQWWGHVGIGTGAHGGWYPAGVLEPTQ